FFGFEPLGDKLPDAKPLRDVRRRRITAQIELGLLLFRAVTIEAILFDERLNGLREPFVEQHRRGLVGRRRAGARRERKQGGQQSAGRGHRVRRKTGWGSKGGGIADYA